MLKILMLASECVPFAKTGGMADVVGSLPIALAKLGMDVRVAMPHYSIIDSRTFGLQPLLASFPVPLDGHSDEASILQTTISGGTVPVYFVDNPRLYARDGIYMYPDDAERFIFFCRAALEMCRRLDWKPDVIHAHDWQTAVAPNWLKTIYAGDPFFKHTASVYTIHNLAYQGIFGRRELEIAGLAPYGFVAHPDLSPDINHAVDFMARGILFGDAITTVSERYAQEILTPEYGEKLDAILLARKDRLFGILNGIDYERFNPLTDPNIPHHYDGGQDTTSVQRRAEAGEPPAAHGDLPAKGKRAANKAALQVRAEAERRCERARDRHALAAERPEGHLPAARHHRAYPEARRAVRADGHGRCGAGAVLQRLAAALSGARGVRADLRPDAGRADLCRQRPLPDAVALRARRHQPDDRAALRRGAGRARHGRAGGHRPRLRPGHRHGQRLYVRRDGSLGAVHGGRARRRDVQAPRGVAHDPAERHAQRPVVDALRAALRGRVPVRHREARGGRHQTAGAGRRHRAHGAGHGRAARAHPAAERAGLQPVVDVEPGRAEPVRGDRPGALGGAAAQPGEAAARGEPGADRGGRARCGVLRAVRPRAAAVRRLHGRARHLVRRALPVRHRRPHRLPVVRVRAARIAADLLRRPGRAGGRHVQGGQRPGRAAGGGRLPLPAGLLPPADRRAGRAGGARREGELRGGARGGAARRRAGGLQSPAPWCTRREAACRRAGGLQSPAPWCTSRVATGEVSRAVVHQPRGCVPQTERTC